MKVVCVCVCVQVSLARVGEDRFSRLLQSTHNLATILMEVRTSFPSSLSLSLVISGLQVALAADVSKHVEELMNYFTITFTVDPSGALLCVQQVTPQLLLSVPQPSPSYSLQLLNALFGMNAAAQHTPIHSPYLSSLPFELHSLQRSARMLKN